MCVCYHSIFLKDLLYFLWVFLTAVYLSLLSTLFKKYLMVHFRNVWNHYIKVPSGTFEKYRESLYLSTQCVQLPTHSSILFMITVVVSDV